MSEQRQYAKVTVEEGLYRILAQRKYDGSQLDEDIDSAVRVIRYLRDAYFAECEARTRAQELKLGAEAQTEYFLGQRETAQRQAQRLEAKDAQASIALGEVQRFLEQLPSTPQRDGMLALIRSALGAK